MVGLARKADTSELGGRELQSGEKLADLIRTCLIMYLRRCIVYYQSSSYSRSGCANALLIVG